MKIKTLAVCLWALSFITLSSCNRTQQKEKYGRYSEDFVGEYTMTITPLLKTVTSDDVEHDFPLNPIDEVPLTIEQCDQSNNGLHLYVGRTEQNINFIGNCDENGMYIYEGAIKTEIDTEEYGEIELDLIMPTTPHIEAPVNSYISMQVPVSGYVTYFMENDTVATTSQVIGDIKASGFKIDYDAE